MSAKKIAKKKEKEYRIYGRYSSHGKSKSDILDVFETDKPTAAMKRFQEACGKYEHYDLRMERVEVVEKVVNVATFDFSEKAGRHVLEVHRKVVS